MRRFKSKSAPDRAPAGRPSRSTRARFRQKTAVLERQTEIIDLDWYEAWITHRLDELPRQYHSIKVRGESVSGPRGFHCLAVAVDEYLCKSDGCSIDEVIEHLCDTDIIEVEKEFDREDDILRNLLFACLGWRTMLYRPTFNVHPLGSLTIHQDDDKPNSGLVFDTYSAPADLSDRPLSVLFKYFGNLLPARSPVTTHVAAEASKTAVSWTALWPEEINAYLLQTLLHVRFRWVDSLALHLDYDKSTQTLSLFRYPSLCATMLKREPATIFSFASVEQFSADPRADAEDIEAFLREILLSYRLLFGQSPKARKLFRRVSSALDRMPHNAPDTLLPVLCTSRRLTFGSDTDWMPEDRVVYFLPKDFSVLHSRIGLLVSELENVKPRTMGDLIRDKRDQYQYWTFWSISILGGIGILLGVVQIALAALQVTQGG